MANRTLAKGGIRRGPRLTTNFTTLSNAVINDDRLSFRARGVLMHLLSKPADWEPRSIAIAAQSPREGRDAIRTAMRELEALGYLTLERVRNDDGTYRMVQIIHEIPVDPSAAPGPGNPEDDSSGAGEPGSTQRTDRARTETNTPTAREADPSPTPSTPKVGVVDLRADGKFDDLAAACRERGLAARWDRIKPDQAADIEALRALHGVDALATAALYAHRADNPTKWAQGYLGVWSHLPAPKAEGVAALPTPRSATPAWSSCGRCNEHGWIDDPADPYGSGLLCPCARSRTSVAA